MYAFDVVLFLGALFPSMFVAVFAGGPLIGLVRAIKTALEQ